MSNNTDKLEVYKDDSGAWRWRLKSRNGKTLADSAEGYKKLSHCKKMGTRVTGLEPHCLDGFLL